MTHIHSVGLLWARDRPVAETSTWKHKIPTRDRYPYPGVIRTRYHSKRTATDPRLRPRGNWYRHSHSNLAVFLLIAYPTLIPYVDVAIPSAEAQNHRTSWWTIYQWHWLPSASINPSTFNTDHLVAAEVRDRIYKQARLQNVSWIFVCAPGICWSRSSC